MDNLTNQMKTWGGGFGKEYTDRNVRTLKQVAASYAERYGEGVTPTKLKGEFIGHFSRSMRILEVGSNVGNQLLWLQTMGFKNLCGIELQSYAVELSKSRTKNINLITGSAFDIPFKDGFFDLVFTDGVLIHISPSNIVQALKEIYRCTNRYIWGFEYYADEYTEITYRQHHNLMWKANFAKLYLDKFPGLELLKEKHLKYINSDNEDSMFLLKKRIVKND